MSALRPSRYATNTTATSTTSNHASSSTTGTTGASTSSTSADKSALAYLLRYESMVRTQDVEDDATSSHLRPLFERLIAIGTLGANAAGGTANGTGGKGGELKGGDGIPDLIASKSTSTDEGDHAADQDNDGTVLTYSAMRHALARLDQQDNTSISKSGDGNNSAGDKNGGEGEGGEVLTTDRQLMLLLRTIVDAVDSISSKDTHSEAEVASEGGLTYAEFLQVYKVVVGGMQSLQRVPKTGNNNDDTSISSNNDEQLIKTTKENNADVRLRIRERTLDLIKLFAPKSSAHSKDGNAPTSSIDAAAVSSLREDDSCSSSVSSLPSLPGGRKLRSSRKTNKNDRSSSKKKGRGSKNKSGGKSLSGHIAKTSYGNKYQDPTDLPRDSTYSTLSMASVASTITDAEDVRRVLTIKDRTMLNLLSDHAGEMDDLTEKMVEMSRRNKRKRKKVLILGIGMGLVGLMVGLMFGGLVGGEGATTTARSSSTTLHGDHPSEALLNDIKYARRELGQANAKVTKLQKRVADAEADGARAASKLDDCRSELQIAGREVEELKVENALVKDEVDSCNAAVGKTKQKLAEVTAASNSKKSNVVVVAPTNKVGPMMKQTSTALSGAAVAVLLPQLAAVVAGGGFQVLAAAGPGLWAGVGLLIGAVVSGALPNLLGRK